MRANNTSWKVVLSSRLKFLQQPLFAMKVIVSLRIIFLITHLLLTFGLTWTRQPMITVTLQYSDRNNQSLANQYDDQFLGLIIFNMILLLMEMLFLMFNLYNMYNIFYVTHMVLDIIASFFVFWMIMDGWDWKTFIFILVFCSLVPLIYDVLEFVFSLIKQRKLKS